jgi:signal transduction histidine kinase
MLLENYFTPKRKDSQTPEDRMGLLTVKFVWISTLFAIGYWGFSFVTGFLLPRYLMAMLVFLFVTELFCYKYRWLSRKTVAHVFVFLCWLVVMMLTMGSQGIHSYVLPWLALIPIIALVLLTQRDAWIWSGIGFACVLLFLFVDTDILPAGLRIATNSLWIASLNIGLLFIVLILTYIFDNQQNNLIQKIEQQNESLKASQEEITLQRDTVELQNRQLEEAHSLIEKQHAELQVRHDELEEEIARRTKDLVEYTQQLEQFTFVASHNLRAPIARINGLANLLELTNTDIDEKFVREKLIASTRELNEVVKDLNLILEIRKGSVTAFSEINVKEEIELILRNLEKDITDTRAIIETSLENIPPLHTIRPYFDSIFLNLVSNAIKYRKLEAPPHIRITASVSGNHIHFCVSDNGIGIDLEKYRSKLFRLYGRLHSHVDGKGLGLYLVKTQIEMLEGKIDVSSTLHEGTEFRFSLKIK